MAQSRIVRHASEIGQWEMVQGEPPAALRPYIREYVGWFEHMSSPLCRRELPTEIIPVIVNFGSPVRIFESDDLKRWTDHSSFTTGAYDRYVLVGSAGPSGGLQINFTILGARLFLGRPLADLTNSVVALDDVLGAAGRRLVDELYSAASWEARFAMVDREVVRRLAAARALTPEVLCSWHRLSRTHGMIPIHDLVRETGWSQKHLIARFREQLGLAPKTLARVLRFGRAVTMIKTGSANRLSDIALECGYYDQAHFSRDVAEFAGISPRELVRSFLPDSGGFRVDG
jgi:AraC-like DNA-binding protein